MIAKESERFAEDSESRATDFEDAADITFDITVDSVSVIPLVK